MQSPLQLKDLKILRVQFDTRQVEEPGTDLEFSHAIEVHHSEEEGSPWLVRLDVQFKPRAEEDQSPYLGEVVVVGIFALDPEFPEEKSVEMVSMNAGAILYGAVRELLSNISSRGIHGPILLPMLDARCFVLRNSEERLDDKSVNVS
jgi:preprotein translocase subunit SecB